MKVAGVISHVEHRQCLPGSHPPLHTALLSTLVQYSPEHWCLSVELIITVTTQLSSHQSWSTRVTSGWWCDMVFDRDGASGRAVWMENVMPGSSGHSSAGVRSLPPYQAPPTPSHRYFPTYTSPWLLRVRYFPVLIGANSLHQRKLPISCKTALIERSRKLCEVWWNCEQWTEVWEQKIVSVTLVLGEDGRIS